MQYDRQDRKTTWQHLCEPLSMFVERYLTTLSASCTLFIVLMLFSCGESGGNKKPAYTDRERLQLDTTDNHTKNIDSLMSLVQRYHQSGDRCREMAALAALGHGYQTTSRYADAVKAHQQQLVIAEDLADTLMAVSALNDLGVNYRRLGLHYNGLDYHLRAIEASLAPEHEDNKKMLKCRAIGYNGAGNVYLVVNSFRKADEMLRKALAVETRLGSHLGMNVDLSNIGLVFEHRGMIDSAWIYYKQSMVHSKLAGSFTGQAYGHMNLGRLYALKGDYKHAIQEFHRSMNSVYKDRDLWLWIQPCLALAEAYVAVGMADSACQQLNRAMKTAQHIGAKDYTPKIHRLYARLYEKQNNYRKALEAYRKAETLEDSLLNARNLFEIETLQSNISNRLRAQADAEKENELQRERWVKRISLLGILFLLTLLAAMIYIRRIRIRSYRALKQMSSMRENFFTNITHEFRTPLTVILGMSRALADAEDSTEATREKAQVIERQGNGLLVLVNQLLDISKMKSAVGDPDWRYGNIVAWLEMMIESYREYARSRNVVLQFVSAGAVEMDFVPDYINKVMNNLLSNAFKFTPEYGRVDVSVKRSGDQLLIDVTDTGRGIGPESIAHVFEPFYQEESELATTGTGVGLALVKQIIDAMNGTIQVESRLGKGTTFHVSLPIQHSGKRYAPAPEGANIAIQPAETTMPTDSDVADDDIKRLLVIEDNGDVAAYIGSQLTDRYAVFYASNGLQGLEKAKELVPDLIITDLMMPGMDGLELCRQVRSSEIIDHIPIIVITAKISEADRVKGLENGADAYLSKPFNSDELRMRVEKLLEQRRLLREKYSQMVEEKEEESTPQSDAERRFLTKVTDSIYFLLNNRKEVDVEIVASRMCMSSRQFHRKITALTGYTPKGFLQRIKISKARHLLDRNPQLSFSDVADQCGFSDYSNFVRAFKNVYGITPTQYLRSEDNISTTSLNNADD